VRGLRLASSEPEAEPGNAAQADDEPPPPDPTSPAGRPALKRIK